MKDNKYHILCPLDGTERSETVLAALMPLARSCDPRVTLLEVMTDLGAPLDARHYTAKARDALRAHHISAECEYRMGKPSREILAFARESQVNLIAMATRGRSGLSRMLHASVTEEVLRHADVPVLICRSGQILRDWKRILVPLDESVSVNDLLSDITFIARQTGASVELLQAVLPVPTVACGAGGTWMDAYGTSREALTPYLKEVSDRLASRGITVRPERRWILSAYGILDRLSEGDIDLVCMTTQGRSGLSRLLMGSTAEDVLRHAPCPVFIRRAAPNRHGSSEEPRMEALGVGRTGESGKGGPPQNEGSRIPN